MALLNLFVGVLVNTFADIRAKEEGNYFLSESQKQAWRAPRLCPRGASCAQLAAHTRSPRHASCLLESSASHWNPRNPPCLPHAQWVEMMEMMMAIKPVRRLKCPEAPWRASCYLLATQPLFESTVRNKRPLVASYRAP